MAKILFCFAGTNLSGKNYGNAIERNEDNNFSEDVIRIYIEGCQHPRVGGNGVFPNLDIVANHIDSAFTGKTLDLKKLQENLGDGISFIVTPPNAKNKEQSVDSDPDHPKIEKADIHSDIEKIDNNSENEKIECDQIMLQGYSRGAVTCFAVAKALDHLDIPIGIIANQPVPGQMKESGLVRNLYKKYHDLSTCKNIHSATILLANHNLENKFVQNNFFLQMVAKFPPTIAANIYQFPLQDHGQWGSTKIVRMHIAHQLALQNYVRYPSTTLLARNTPSYSTFLANKIKKTYASHLIGDDYYLYFTPRALSQGILGAHQTSTSIQIDPLYVETVQDIMKERLKSILDAPNQPFHQQPYLLEKRSATENSLKEIKLALQELTDEVKTTVADHDSLQKKIDAALKNNDRQTALPLIQKLIALQKEWVISKKLYHTENKIQTLLEKQNLQLIELEDLKEAIKGLNQADTHKQLLEAHPRLQVLLSKKETINNLGTEQARAIFALQRSGIPEKDIFRYLELILKEPNNKETFGFSNYINAVTEATEYLTFTLANQLPLDQDGFFLKTEDVAKLDAVKEEAHKYQKAVFKSCYHYLNEGIKTNPKGALKIFEQQEASANQIFKRRALSKERNHQRRTMAIITNVFLHLTGLCLLVNTTHKLLTGRWLLFKRNRSEKRFSALQKSIRQRNRSVPQDNDMVSAERIPASPLSNQPEEIQPSKSSSNTHRFFRSSSAAEPSIEKLPSEQSVRQSESSSDNDPDVNISSDASNHHV